MLNSQSMPWARVIARQYTPHERGNLSPPAGAFCKDLHIGNSLDFAIIVDWLSAHKSTLNDNVVHRNERLHRCTGLPSQSSQVVQSPHILVNAYFREKRLPGQEKQSLTDCIRR